MCPPFTLIISCPELGRCVTYPMSRGCRGYRPDYEKMLDYTATQLRVTPDRLTLHLASAWVDHSHGWCASWGSNPLTSETWKDAIDRTAEGDSLVAELAPLPPRAERARSAVRNAWAAVVAWLVAVVAWVVQMGRTSGRNVKRVVGREKGVGLPMPGEGYVRMDEGEKVRGGGYRD